MAQPFYTLSSIIPNGEKQQPRCAAIFNDEQLSIGYVNGTAITYECVGGEGKPHDSGMTDATKATGPYRFHPIPDTEHKISDGSIYGMIYVPEGHESYTEGSLICGGFDKCITNVLTDGTELSKTPNAHDKAVEGISFGLDPQKTLITAGWDGNVKWWSFGELLLSVQYKNQHSVQFCSLSTDGLFVMASANKNVTMCKLDYQKLYEHHEMVQSGAAQPLTEKEAIHQQILTICNDTPNAHDHVIRRVIPLHPDTAKPFSRPAKHFLTVGNDGCAKIWELRKLKDGVDTFALVVSLNIIYGDQNQAEFLYDVVQLPTSPQYNDDMMVAISCDDKTVRIINISAALREESLAEAAAQNLATYNKLKSPDTIAHRHHSPYEVCCVSFPSTPRMVYQIGQTPQLVVVTAAGAFVLTAAQQNQADESTLDLFNATMQAAIDKAKKMQDIDVETLPTPEVLFTPGGAAEQPKIVNIDGKPMVVMWSAEKFEWELVGEAMGSKNGGPGGAANAQGGATMKNEHEGKAYDQIVDVDIGGGRMIKLPFDRDDDPYEVAQAFCLKHGLSQDAVHQIVQFINPYIDMAAMQRKRQKLEDAKKMQVSTFSTTNWSYVLRISVNIKAIHAALIKRLGEIAADPTQHKLLWPSLLEKYTATQSLQDLEKDPKLYHLCQVAADAITLEPRTRFDASDEELLTHILTHWPNSLMTPVLDILRVLCCESGANTALFNPSTPSLQPNPFHTEFNTLMNQKMSSVFAEALVVEDKNSFASLSLTFDIFNNMLGKRTNHRTASAALLMFKYFNSIYTTITTSKHPTTGLDIAGYITATNNKQFGGKILSAIVKFVYNMLSCSNRMAAFMGENVGFITEYHTITNKWLMFLLSVYNKLITNNTMDLAYTANVYEMVHMLCFAANFFKNANKMELYNNILSQYKNVVQVLKNALYSTVITTPQPGVSRLEQENTLTLANDCKVLFFTK